MRNYILENRVPIVFGGKYDEYTDRYATWDEAVSGHDQMVKMVMGDGR
jgi:hypothetical protein